MVTRKKICPECSNHFEYEVSRGKDRKYCDQVCGDKAGARKYKAKALLKHPCEVEGCGLPAIRIDRYCEKHYMRVRRHGGTEKRTTLKQGDLIHSGGSYLLTHAPEHPLANGRSRVYAHRMAYYAVHGAGPFSCHHCGIRVDWTFMHVDHLDDNPQNNDVSNLAASCPRCNIERGRPKNVRISKQNAKKYDYLGISASVSEWAAAFGVTVSAMQYRLKTYDVETAIGEATPRAARPEGWKPKARGTPRKVARYTHEGLTLTLREWAEQLGLKPKYLAYMIATHGPTQGISKADPAKQRTTTADLSHRSHKG